MELFYVLKTNPESILIEGIKLKAVDFTVIKFLIDSLLI